MVYEADESGVLAIIVAEGKTVAIGEPIASLGPPGAAGPAPVTAAAAPATAASPVAANGGARRTSASPVARRAAAKLGVALESVSGSGPNERIFKADVVRAAERAPQTAIAASVPAAEPRAPAAVADAKGEVEVVDLSRLQRTIARRMAESKATAPHFTLTREVDMTEALVLRAELKRQGAGAPSVNDLIVRACALALRAHPKVNGSYVDGHFAFHPRINIGIAVSTEDGLVVPVIQDADALSFSQLALESRALAERTRDGTITPPQLAGGTFTVSNLGMYGVDAFAGVINPPQAAILCVGATRPRPVVGEDGTVVGRELAALTLVSDHRILYGADSAAFLRDLEDLLTRPLALLA